MSCELLLLHFYCAFTSFLKLKISSANPCNTFFRISPFVFHRRYRGLEEFVIYDHKIRRCETLWNVSCWTVESNGRLNTWQRCCNSNSTHKPHTHTFYILTLWLLGLFAFHESFISILLFCSYEAIMNPAGLTMLRKNCFHFNGHVYCQHDLFYTSEQN